MKRISSTKPVNPPNSVVASTAMSGSSSSSRGLLSERHQRPGPAIFRFLIKYRCFVVPIGLFMLVHLILAFSLAYLHCTEDLLDDQPGLRKLKSNLTTVVPSVLDLETLSFIPECNITSREAVSAIQRAKTQSCKQQLAEKACRIVEDSLYPKKLNRQCLNNETSYGKSVGCFRDDKKTRVLPDSFFLLKENNSPTNCIDMCLQSGFQYAGVQYGVECFCGNAEPSSNLEISLTECNMKCPESLSNNAQSELKYCGGYFAIHVYQTGVFLDQDGKSNAIGLEDYDSSHLTIGGKPPRIVFFLTLNGRAVRQVLRLIKALFHEKHFFYIHVDARQDYLFRELLSLSRKLPNNFKFMTNRKSTIWGGASLLTVLLSGMEDLILHSPDWDWDYVINLSESDFPLKSTSKLEYFLSVNNGKNFLKVFIQKIITPELMTGIHFNTMDVNGYLMTPPNPNNPSTPFLKSHGRDVQKFIQKQGLDKTFYECEYRMWRIGDRKLPTGILMDGGSDWIALHRDFVRYAVESKDELVTGLKTVFKYTLLPAESFFHILLRNSEMCDSFVDNNLHVTNWKRKLGCKCQYRNIVDWCGCSPNDFRLADWNKLQLTESRLLFFGRKFESIVNQGIVNHLEGWLYPELYEKNFPTMDSFWLSLYHHHDLSPKPDDALVTLGKSLSRIAFKRFLSKLFPAKSSMEDLGFIDSYSHKIDLIEITAYNHDDQLEGILVKFRTSFVDDNREELDFGLEAWFKQDYVAEAAAKNARTREFHKKLKDFKVGGDYEQKEQIFRNYAGALGPFSDPTLTYTVHTDEPFNISVIWIDPGNLIRSSSNATASDGSTANFVKPTFKHPLTPGNWTVHIYSIEQDLIYRVEFLVLPLEVYQGNDISLSERRLFNFENFDKSDTSFTSSRQLQVQIDSLVSKHYTLQDYCLEYPLNHATLTKLILRKDDTTGVDSNHHQQYGTLYGPTETVETSLCSHTQWSSFYPDPKAAITGIDSETGLLMP